MGYNHTMFFLILFALSIDSTYGSEPIDLQFRPQYREVVDIVDCLDKADGVGVRSIPNHEIVRAIQKNGDWYQVIYGGTKCWLHRRDFTNSQAPSDVYDPLRHDPYSNNRLMHLCHDRTDFPAKVLAAAPHKKKGMSGLRFDGANWRGDQDRERSYFSKTKLEKLLNFGITRFADDQIFVLQLCSTPTDNLERVAKSKKIALEMLQTPLNQKLKVKSGLSSKVGTWCGKTNSQEKLKLGFLPEEVNVTFSTVDGVVAGVGFHVWPSHPNELVGAPGYVNWVDLIPQGRREPDLEADSTNDPVAESPNNFKITTISENGEVSTWSLDLEKNILDIGRGDTFQLTRECKNNWPNARWQFLGTWTDPKNPKVKFLSRSIRRIEIRRCDSTGQVLFPSAQ